MFWLDTHMHFDLYENREKVLEEIEHSCSYTIAVTNLPELYARYQQQLDWNKYKYCRLALGLHPELVAQYGNQIDSFIEMLPYARFIGEVGLDFTSNDNQQRKSQMQVFQRIIDECSKTRNKILSIHTRKAAKETLQIMASFSGRAIFHWYSGSPRDLREALERGYFFSVNHQMLKSESGRKIVDSIPIERMLIESDAPFTKGLENHYSLFFVKRVYEYLSNARHIEEEQLSRIIKNNFKELLE